MGCSQVSAKAAQGRSEAVKKMTHTIICSRRGTKDFITHLLFGAFEFSCIGYDSA
jgi:hypothetical protein